MPDKAIYHGVVNAHNHKALKLMPYQYAMPIIAISLGRRAFLLIYPSV